MPETTDLDLKKRNCWQIQRDVVFALYLRELGARFGLYRMGYFWAIAEPIAMILVLSAIRIAMGRQDIIGLPYPLFFASGILPFQFFQTSAIQGLTSVESNKALLNYQIVKPIDAVLARLIVEMVVYSITAILIFTGMDYFGFTFTVRNYLGLCTVLALLSMLTLGFALVTSVVGPLYHESKKVIPIVMRPLFFLSGVFFSVDIMPPAVRNVLLWNPLLHVNELVRYYLFKESTVCYGNMGYLALCSLLFLFFGLSFYRYNRFRVATSGEIR